MINFKPAVVAALSENNDLVALLGGARIYQSIAPSMEEFPRITFFEMDNVDSMYADDEACSSDIKMQIDIWSKGSTSAIAGEVDKTMKKIGFKRDSSADLFEEDTKIFHKAMRYSINLVFEEVD